MPGKMANESGAFFSFRNFCQKLVRNRTIFMTKYQKIPFVHHYFPLPFGYFSAKRWPEGKGLRFSPSFDIFKNKRALL